MKTSKNAFEKAIDGLVAEYNRILKSLDREARADRCAGDIVCGWDWPTLRIVKPAVYSRLMAIRHEVHDLNAGVKSAGLSATQKA